MVVQQICLESHNDEHDYDLINQYFSQNASWVRLMNRNYCTEEDAEWSFVCLLRLLAADAHFLDMSLFASDGSNVPTCSQL